MSSAHREPRHTALVCMPTRTMKTFEAAWVTDASPFQRRWERFHRLEDGG